MSLREGCSFPTTLAHARSAGEQSQISQEIASPHLSDLLSKSRKVPGKNGSQHLHLQVQV